MGKITFKEYEKRKEKTFQFIKEYINKNGYAPSYREIATGTGICIDTVFNHLNKLRDEEKITYINNRARTIKIK